MVRNAIEGFNNMPPLGYCMDCEESDFLELTRYMAPDK
jgi:cytochrome c5